MLNYILGITKAYTTRVGGGPFPSELDIDDESSPGFQMSHKGKEFGTVTQRKRRCGWFDAAALKRSAMINGLSGLCITKLDILDGIKTLKICIGYKVNNEKYNLLPLGADQVDNCEPIFIDMPGWDENTFGTKQWDELPVNAQKYLLKLEELCGVNVHIVSTGPERDQTIVINHPFD
jgi:adenylosuccinate synthase